MPITDIRNLSQYKELLESNHIVIINAWATWCGPCRIISPDFEKLSKNDKYNKPGVTFAKVDIDAVYEVVKELSVRSVPTFYAFNNGTLERALMGADPGGLEQLVKEATSKVESNWRMTLDHLRAKVFEDRVQELFWC